MSKSELIERIPKSEEIKRELAPHLRVVELLKGLLKLAEHRERLEGKLSPIGGAADE